MAINGNFYGNLWQFIEINEIFMEIIEINDIFMTIN